MRDLDDHGPSRGEPRLNGTLLARAAYLGDVMSRHGLVVAAFSMLLALSVFLLSRDLMLSALASRRAPSLLQHWSLGWWSLAPLLAASVVKFELSFREHRRIRASVDAVHRQGAASSPRRDAR